MKEPASESMRSLNMPEIHIVFGVEAKDTSDEDNCLISENKLYVFVRGVEPHPPYKRLLLEALTSAIHEASKNTSNSLRRENNMKPGQRRSKSRARPHHISGTAIDKINRAYGARYSHNAVVGGGLKEPASAYVCCR